MVFTEFSKRSEQPSVPDDLCSALRTASPQLHQHHISMSVSYILYEMKSSSHLIVSPQNHFAFSHPFSSFKRHPAVDREAGWSPGSPHGALFLLHPVCHGHPDSAQSRPEEQRGRPQPCWCRGVHFINRLQDPYVYKYTFIPLIYLFSHFLPNVLHINTRHLSSKI